MLQQGRPTPTSTSTSMGAASMPTTAADATRTNMPRVFASAMPAHGPQLARALRYKPAAVRPGVLQLDAG